MIGLLDGCPGHRRRHGSGHRLRNRWSGIGRGRILITQQLLHAANGVTFLAEQAMNPPRKIDIGRAIVAPVAGALHRLQLRETSLPLAQDVLRDAQLLRQFADSQKGAGVFLSGSGQGQSFAIWSRMIWLARKVMTRRGAIGTSMPVFGLRPMR